MRLTKKSLFFAAVFIGAAFSLPVSTMAQCGPNTVAWSSIALVAGSPFEAEIVTTATGKPETLLTRPALVPVKVARDSEGRIRTERIVANIKIKTGVDAGQEKEQHIITICDPVAETLTRIDTVEKTAMIYRAPQSRIANTLRAKREYCRPPISVVNSDGVTVEDLGHRMIEGLDAEGVRRTIHLAIPGRNGTEQPERVSEEWCAKDIEATVLRVFYSSAGNRKQEEAFRNLTRSEPDPLLFQIPADYTVMERVLSDPPRTGASITPKPVAGSSVQWAPPSR